MLRRLADVVVRKEARQQQVQHELAVHRQYYRLQDDVVELAKVSELLIAVKQGKAHRFAGQSLDDYHAPPVQRRLLRLVSIGQLKLC